MINERQLVTPINLYLGTKDQNMGPLLVQTQQLSTENSGVLVTNPTFVSGVESQEQTKTYVTVIEIPVLTADDAHQPLIPCTGNLKLVSGCRGMKEGTHYDKYLVEMNTAPKGKQK